AHWVAPQIAPFPQSQYEAPQSATSTDEQRCLSDDKDDARQNDQGHCSEVTGSGRNGGERCPGRQWKHVDQHRQIAAYGTRPRNPSEQRRVGTEHAASRRRREHRSARLAEHSGGCLHRAAPCAAGDTNERSGHVNLRVVRTFRVTNSPRRTEFSPVSLHLSGAKFRNSLLSARYSTSNTK